MAERDVYEGEDLVPVEINAPFHLREKREKHLRELADKMRAAGWTDDPMDGTAFHLPDGREVCNPLQLAPPIGYRPEPTIMEMIQQQVNAHLKQLQGDDEVDTIEEADDFDMDEEWDPTSLYEIRELIPEAPRLPVTETVTSNATDAVKDAKGSVEKQGDLT